MKKDSKLNPEIIEEMNYLFRAMIADELRRPGPRRDALIQELTKNLSVSNFVEGDSDAYFDKISKNSEIISPVLFEDLQYLARHPILRKEKLFPTGAITQLAANYRCTDYQKCECDGDTAYCCCCRS